MEKWLRPQEEPLMSVSVCFQCPSTSSHRSVDRIPWFSVNWQCCGVGSHPNEKWKTFFFSSYTLMNVPLNCKRRTQENNDIPFLFVFLLGSYWATGSAHEFLYCYDCRWGCKQSQSVNWNSGLDLSWVVLEGFGNGLEVFQSRVPDWLPFAVTPPASASSDMWMRWMPPDAGRNVLSFSPWPSKILRHLTCSLTPRGNRSYTIPLRTTGWYSSNCLGGNVLPVCWVLRPLQVQDSSCSSVAWVLNSPHTHKSHPLD